MAITRLLTLVSSAILVCVASMSLGEDERATRYMTRYLRGEYGTNISVIVKEVSEDKAITRVKVQRSKDGKIRRSVLYPLHMAFEYTDDGKQVKQYLPDDRQMFVQPSTPIQTEANFRLPLIQKNYTLKSERGKTIAGRRCILVTATPKFGQVPSVRYQFDETIGFPMGMDTVASDGDIIGGFEVQEIKFPSKIDDDTFKITPVAGVEVVTYDEQKSLAKVSDAAPKLGFMPIVPSTLPLGFQTQKILVRSQNGCAYLCLKVSDGIQRATIFEWRYVPGEQIKTGEAETAKVCRGVKIIMIGDLGSELREIFLRPFVARIDRESPAMLTSIGL